MNMGFQVVNKETSNGYTNLHTTLPQGASSSRKIPSRLSEEEM